MVLRGSAGCDPISIKDRTLIALKSFKAMKGFIEVSVVFRSSGFISVEDRMPSAFVEYAGLHHPDALRWLKQ